MNKTEYLIIGILLLMILSLTGLAASDYIIQPGTGNSMQPTLNYFSCTIDTASPEKIEVGDIVVGPEKIRHRITDIYEVGDKTWIYRQGDNNEFGDPPIFKEDVKSKALIKCFFPWESLDKQ